MKAERYTDWHLVAGLIGVGLLLTILAFVGLHFLFLTSTLDTLAWLLSGSLIALPGLAGFAYYLGKTEARGALAAMEWTMKTAVNGIAPMNMAATRQWAILEKEVDRQASKRIAEGFMAGMSEAVPQLPSGTRRVQGEVVDNGEVTL